MAGEVSFFELGVEDADRGRAFYEGLFEWSFARGPSGRGWLIDTPTLAGGMHPGDRGAAPYVFFRVDDLDQALTRVRELGGTVDDSSPEGDADSEETFGRFKLCTDDQGSTFGLHQPPAADR
jgi:predicted enzyme related to lactoylglutathione lyase